MSKNSVKNVHFFTRADVTKKLEIYSSSFSTHHRVEKYLFPSPIPAIILHHQRWKNRTFVYNNYIQTPNIIHGSIYMHIVFETNVS